MEQNDTETLKLSKSEINIPRQNIIPQDAVEEEEGQVSEEAPEKTGCCLWGWLSKLCGSKKKPGQ